MDIDKADDQAARLARWKVRAAGEAALFGSGGVSVVALVADAPQADDAGLWGLAAGLGAIAVRLLTFAAPK